MNKFFDISSVGVVGASKKEGKLSNDILKYLSIFPGKKYGVNPNGGSFMGIKFYSSISSLPEVVDILIFVIRAPLVLDSLREAAKLGIKRVIIVSAGFSEVGNYESENEIKKVVLENNILLLGPNCLGYTDTYSDLNLSFGIKEIKKGNISVISQSGAMAVAISDWALEHNLGFSKIISLGNKCGIDEVDLLSELEDDENTKVIVLYLESLLRGELFFSLAKRISKTKPIIILKSGISNIGQIAASSHTGAIANDNNIMINAFREAGLHYTNTLEDFLSYIEIFSRYEIQKIPDELTIITNAGGPGVISTDYAEKYAVKLAQFNDKEKSILRSGISAGASLNNPIDIIGDATSGTYSQILNNIDSLNRELSLLILLTPQSVTDVENIAEVISLYKKNSKGYLVTSFIGGIGVKGGKKILNENNIINYCDPQMAIKCYKKLLEQKKWSAMSDYELEEIDVPSNYNELEELLGNEDIFEMNIIGRFFDAYGINYLKEYFASELEEVEKVYGEINYSKLVAKVVSKNIAHKSDVGGIVLNINNLEEAKKAYIEINENIKKNAPKSKIEGITYSKMLGKNGEQREIFLGFKRDSSFGDVIILGMGGIYVNVFNDTATSIGIVTKEKIKEMLLSLKYYEVLKGTRGKKGINLENLIKLIFGLQFIFKHFKKIKEIDINPIFCDESESIIVDAKFYV